MNELAVIEGGPAEAGPRGGVNLLAVAGSAAQVKALGAELLESGLLPQSVKKPEAAMAIMLQGAELGIGPMQSLRSINVVQGSPTLSAELMRSLVHRGGHVFRVLESTVEACVVEGARRDDPKHVQRVRWTTEDAERAGVAGKDNWKKHPRAMLKARATSELCRDMFPDVIAGCSYVPEELGVEADEEDRIVVEATHPSAEHAPKPAAIVRPEPRPEDAQSPLPDDPIKEIKQLYDLLPEEVIAGRNLKRDLILDYARTNKAKAYQAYFRMHHFAAEAGVLPEQSAPAAEAAGKAPPAEPETENPNEPLTAEQEAKIMELTDVLYDDKDTLLDGWQWYQKNVLMYPIADLSRGAAEMRIGELEEEGIGADDA